VLLFFRLSVPLPVIAAIPVLVIQIIIVCFCLLQEIIRERHSFKNPHLFFDFSWSMHCPLFTGFFCLTMEENNFLIIVGMMELLCFCCLIYHGNSVNFVSMGVIEQIAWSSLGTKISELL